MAEERHIEVTYPASPETWNKTDFCCIVCGERVVWLNARDRKDYYQSPPNHLCSACGSTFEIRLTNAAQVDGVRAKQLREGR